MNASDFAQRKTMRLAITLVTTMESGCVMSAGVENSATQVNSRDNWPVHYSVNLHN